jgi:hypothetical protein
MKDIFENWRDFREKETLNEVIKPPLPKRTPVRRAPRSQSGVSARGRRTRVGEPADKWLEGRPHTLPEIQKRIKNLETAIDKLDPADPDFVTHFETMRAELKGMRNYLKDSKMDLRKRIAAGAPEAEAVGQGMSLEDMNKALAALDAASARAQSKGKGRLKGAFDVEADKAAQAAYHQRRAKYDDFQKSLEQQKLATGARGGIEEFFELIQTEATKLIPNNGPVVTYRSITNRISTVEATFVAGSAGPATYRGYDPAPFQRSSADLPMIDPSPQADILRIGSRWERPPGTRKPARHVTKPPPADVERGTTFIDPNLSKGGPGYEAGHPRHLRTLRARLTPEPEVRAKSEKILRLTMEEDAFFRKGTELDAESTATRERIAQEQADFDAALDRGKGRIEQAERELLDDLRVDMTPQQARRAAKGETDPARIGPGAAADLDIRVPTEEAIIIVNREYGNMLRNFFSKLRSITKKGPDWTMSYRFPKALVGEIGEAEASKFVIGLAKITGIAWKVPKYLIRPYKGFAVGKYSGFWAMPGVRFATSPAGAFFVARYMYCLYREFDTEDVAKQAKSAATDIASDAAEAAAKEAVKTALDEGLTDRANTCFRNTVNDLMQAVPEFWSWWNNEASPEDIKKVNETLQELRDAVPKIEGASVTFPQSEQLIRAGYTPEEAIMYLNAGLMNTAAQKDIFSLEDMNERITTSALEIKNNFIHNKFLPSAEQTMRELSADPIAQGVAIAFFKNRLQNIDVPGMAAVDSNEMAALMQTIRAASTKTTVTENKKVGPHSDLNIIFNGWRKFTS